MLWRIGFVMALLAGMSFAVFLWQIERGVSIEAARTATVNTLVMGQIFYLFNCRRLTGAILSRAGFLASFLGNPHVLQAIGVLLVVQVLFTHQPLLQGLFHTTDIDAAAWFASIAAGVALMLVVEAEKGFWRRQTRQKSA